MIFHGGWPSTIKETTAETETGANLLTDSSKKCRSVEVFIIDGYHIPVANRIPQNSRKTKKLEPLNINAATNNCRYQLSSFYIRPKLRTA